MKKIVFLIIASLLVIGLILPGCNGDGPVARPTIKIGVPYPFGTIQGTGMITGAQMAASEINVAGVLDESTNTTYDIQIIGRNDNEIADPANAWHAVDYLVNTAGAQFIVGGFRTEAVIPMFPNVFATASPSVPFIIVGASTGELLSGLGLLYPPPAGFWPAGSGTPYYTFNASTSAHYEYVFRATPMNSGFLMSMVMTLFAQVSQQIQTAANWTWNGSAFPHLINVAIVAENLTWAIPLIGGYQALVGGALGGYFGWNLTGTWTFGDTASSGVVDAALNAIEAAKNQVILTCMSGPCGLTFGKRMGVLGINAIPVGINVEAQDLNYYINSAGGAQYEVTTGTYAQGVNNTATTAKFLADYATYTGGAFPIYTVASYDVVYSIKEAIEATDSLDKDDICDYLRTHDRISTSAHSQYYPDWDQVTVKVHKGETLPAQNQSVIDAIYNATAGHVPYAAYNFTMGPFTTNDLVYGPGYATGLGVQWLNGTQTGMYPKAGYDNIVGGVPIKIQTTLVNTINGLNWDGSLEYPGTQAALIPAAYVTQWQTWFP